MREHWDGCPSVFDLRWDVRVMGVGATRQGKTRELTGKLSMQEGMMEGDWRVRPYGWQCDVNERTLGWMSQYFDLRWNVRVMGCRGDPSGQMRELLGKLSMQEGMMDSDGRVRPYGWQWNVNERMLG